MDSLPEFATSPAILTQEDVSTCLHKFKRWSAPGLSGLRASHVQEAIEAQAEDAPPLLQAVTILINKLARGLSAILWRLGFAALSYSPYENLITAFGQ